MKIPSTQIKLYSTETHQTKAVPPKGTSRAQTFYDSAFNHPISKRRAAELQAEITVRNAQNMIIS